MSSVPNADLVRARASLSQARMQRSEYLIAIADGLITPMDLIQSACEPHGSALRRISLRQLVLAQPRVGERRCHAFLSAVAKTLALNEDLATKNVAWLIDSRSGGRRLLAWIDVAHPRTARATPWPGFPMAPAPQRVARVS